MVQRLGDQRNFKFSSTSASEGIYSWYGQTESVSWNYGRDLGKLQWRKLSGDGNGNGLVTPYEAFLYHHQASFGLESSREAKERSSTEHLETFARS